MATLKTTRPSDATTLVTGYERGRSFVLSVAEVEKGRLLRSDLVAQARAMLQAARAGGMLVEIVTAWRTNDQQVVLYDGWRQRKPGFHPADRPGWSNHQNGTALDLSFRDTDEREHFATHIALTYGFRRPVPGEPWHFVGFPLPAGPDLVA